MKQREGNNDKEGQESVLSRDPQDPRNDTGGRSLGFLLPYASQAWSPTSQQARVPTGMNKKACSVSSQDQEKDSLVDQETLR